ncbi:MAG: hypothetical protein ABIG95_06590 [Candidatus Woesearchaeota archaeon]
MATLGEQLDYTYGTNYVLVLTTTDSYAHLFGNMQNYGHGIDSSIDPDLLAVAFSSAKHLIPKFDRGIVDISTLGSATGKLYVDSGFFSFDKRRTKELGGIAVRKTYGLEKQMIRYLAEVEQVKSSKIFIENMRNILQYGLMPFCAVGKRGKLAVYYLPLFWYTCLAADAITMDEWDPINKVNMNSPEGLSYYKQFEINQQ